MKTLFKIVFWVIIIPELFYQFGYKAGFADADKNTQCAEINITVPKNEVQPIPTATPSASPKKLQSIDSGKVSYYTNDYCEAFNPSCLTASGEPFDDSKFTAACAGGFALGSKVRVSYNGKSVDVVCNDRGSFSESYGRIMDLSKAAFEALAPLSKGVLAVNVEEVSK